MIKWKKFSDFAPPKERWLLITNGHTFGLAYHVRDFLWFQNTKTIDHYDNELMLHWKQCTEMVHKEDLTAFAELEELCEENQPS